MATLPFPISDTTSQLLRELSEKTGRPQPEILDQALEAYRRKMFLEEINAAYAALRANPDTWAEVQAERQSMAGCLMDGLDPKEAWGEDGDLLPPAEGKSDG